MTDGDSSFRRITDEESSCLTDEGSSTLIPTACASQVVHLPARTALLTLAFPLQVVREWDANKVLKKLLEHKLVLPHLRRLDHACLLLMSHL